MTDTATRGIALRILSGVFFTAMALSIKLVSDEVPLGQIVFFRSVFALGPLLVFLRVRREFPRGLATRRPFGHLARAGLGAAAMFATFAALARLPLAEAALLSYLSPAFLALLAVLLLGERMTRWRLGGVALGFLGVAALCAPEILGGDATGRASGYALGLLGAVLTALALIMVRRLSATESPGAIAFYFIVACAVGGLCTLPLGWVVPDVRTLALLVLSGLFGGAAHIAMTLAFGYAEASRLAPFEYITVLWAALVDLLVFSMPLTTAFVAALALVLSGAFVAARERPERTAPTP